MTKHRIPPKPEWFDTVPEGTCRWCNADVGLTKTGRPSKSRWHPHCFEEYELLFWPSSTRKAVWKRDKGRCVECNVQCDKKGPNGWDLDHRIPLIEGDGSLQFWQLGNLQTLCKICHKTKTAREATERATQRRELKMKLQQLVEVNSQSPKKLAAKELTNMLNDALAKSPLNKKLKVLFISDRGQHTLASMADDDSEFQKLFDKSKYQKEVEVELLNTYGDHTGTHVAVNRKTSGAFIPGEEDKVKAEVLKLKPQLIAVAEEIAREISLKHPLVSIKLQKNPDHHVILFKLISKKSSL